MISLIVATANNNAIGKNGDMPWHLPADMKYFKNTTWGMPLIIGRKTFDSLKKALPGRINIVISRQDNFLAENIIAVNNLEQALEEARATNCKEIFIAGGGQIYEQAMSVAERIYLTKINLEIDADTFFPNINDADWQLVKEEHFSADEKNKYDYSFKIFERKKTR